MRPLAIAVVMVGVVLLALGSWLILRASFTGGRPSSPARPAAPAKQPARGSVAVTEAPRKKGRPGPARSGGSRGSRSGSAPSQSASPRPSGPRTPPAFPPAAAAKARHGATRWTPPDPEDQSNPWQRPRNEDPDRGRQAARLPRPAARLPRPAARIRIRAGPLGIRRRAAPAKSRVPMDLRGRRVRPPPLGRAPAIARHSESRTDRTTPSSAATPPPRRPVGRETPRPVSRSRRPAGPP